MKQKTVYTSNRYEIGAEVLLYSRTDAGTGKETFEVSRKYAVEGYPGNLDSNAKAFHGWRGTSNDIETYAYGVRKVKSCTPTDREDMYGDTIYKIVVGEDIHPDWK